MLGNTRRALCPVKTMPASASASWGTTTNHHTLVEIDSFQFWKYILSRGALRWEGACVLARVLRAEKARRVAEL
jgi:hypothetical protein